MATLMIRLFDESSAIIKPSLSLTSLASLGQGSDEEDGSRSAPFTSSPLDEFRGGFETGLKYRAKVRDASAKNTKAVSAAAAAAAAGR